MDARTKELLKLLGEAIDRAVTESEDVESVLGTLRDSGLNVFLVLEANIALDDTSVPLTVTGPGDETLRAEPPEDKFTSDDRRFLRQLKIAL